jgi:WD40 repeat protein
VDKPQSKNKSSVFFVVIVFAAVVIIMFVARMRSGNMQAIAVPLNNGIVGLLTYNNLLGAVSNDNKMYVFEWSNMSKKPLEIAVESSEVVFAAPDTVLSVKQINPNRLVMSGFDANGVNKNIPLSLTSKTAILSSNRDGNKIILLLERGGEEHVMYELCEVGNNTGQIQSVVTVPAEHGKVKNIIVSDDGRYAAAVGEKKEHGWLFAVDIKDKKILWQKELPDLKKLFKGVFSKDGEIVYLRGSDSMLTLVKTSSGEIIDRWMPTKESTYTYKTQQTQAVVISNDGGLVAAVVGGSIFTWDTKTRKKYDITGTGHKVLSSITFSPDAKFIATSDMRQSGDIKIVHVPQH